MSSPETLRLPRRAVAAGLALSAALLLAGCIQPLYKPLANGTDVAAEMRAIKVEPVRDRFGHYLANELIFALNGTGSQEAPKYQLVMTFTQTQRTPILDTVTGRADAATVFASVNFTLLTTGAEPHEVLKGTATASAGYDRSAQRFANIRAARDAEIRLAKVLADQIRTRIAAGFAARS